MEPTIDRRPKGHKTATLMAKYEKLREAGFPRRKIAEKLGVSTSTLYYHISKHEGNLPESKKRKGKTKRREPEMVTLDIPEEPTTNSIAAFYGPTTDVARVIREMLNG